MTNVLIVDDEPHYREHLERILALDGYRVTIAENGRRALELACAARPDVLVVDWMLRDVCDGLDVAQSLRHLNPALITIVITGRAALDVLESPTATGIARVLEKPFDAGELCDAIRQALPLDTEK